MSDILERLRRIDPRTGMTATSDCDAAANEIERLRAQIAAKDAALRNIAEGNLGDGPGQANYKRIKEVARAALSHPNAAGEDLEENQVRRHPDEAHEVEIARLRAQIAAKDAALQEIATGEHGLSARQIALAALSQPAPAQKGQAMSSEIHPRIDEVARLLERIADLERQIEAKDAALRLLLREGEGSANARAAAHAALSRPAPAFKTMGELVDTLDKTNPDWTDDDLKAALSQPATAQETE